MCTLNKINIIVSSTCYLAQLRNRVFPMLKVDSDLSCNGLECEESSIPIWFKHKNTGVIKQDTVTTLITD